MTPLPLKRRPTLHEAHTAELSAMEEREAISAAFAGKGGEELAARCRECSTSGELLPEALEGLRVDSVDTKLRDACCRRGVREARL